MDFLSTTKHSLASKTSDNLEIKNIFETWTPPTTMVIKKIYIHGRKSKKGILLQNIGPLFYLHLILYQISGGLYFEQKAFR